MKAGGKFTGSLAPGASPLLKMRLSSSHPDLSSLHLLQPDDKPDHPEHCLKVFRCDHSCRYLPIHKVRATGVHFTSVILFCICILKYRWCV